MNASSAPRSSTPSLQRSYQLGDRLQPRARWSNTPATTVRCTRADSVLPLPAVPPHERGQHPAQLTPAQSKLAAVRPAMHAYAIPPDPHELTTRSRRRVLCPTATRVAGAADPLPTILTPPASARVRCGCMMTRTKHQGLTFWRWLPSRFSVNPRPLSTHRPASASPLLPRAEIGAKCRRAQLSVNYVAGSQFRICC